MNQDTLSPDDPRITAYALGELEPSERAAFEAELSRNPAARAAIAEIQATVAQLTTAFAAEVASETVKPATKCEPVESMLNEEYRPREKGWWARWLQFPRFYYVAGGFAAACFAVVMAWREPSFHPAPAHPTVEEKIITEVDLGPLPNAAVATAPVQPAMADTDQPVIPAPVIPAAKPELQLADATLATPKEGLPLLEQIKIERRIFSPKDGRTPLVVLGPADGTASHTLIASETRRSGRDRPAAMNVGDSKNPASVAPGKGIGGERVIQLSASGGFSEVKRATNSTVGPRANAPLRDLASLSVTPAQRTFGTETAFNYNYVPALDTVEDFPVIRPRENPSSTESYTYQRENDFLAAAQNPFSTFSIDVDSASYANVRRFILGGRLPPVDAVRIEELVNYFPYQYPAPVLPHDGEKNSRADIDGPPFAASLEVASAPWAPTHRLVRIGLKGREVSTAARPAANLVFLLDVSGSMNQPNKLPLVKESMRLLVGKLRPDDRVAIVTYAGHSGLALASTPATKSREILQALDELTSGGSTNGAMGIQLAYDIAKANHVPGGLNRVILCTDGDFNVGVTSEGELTRLVEEKAKSGVFLTVLGFGMGNLKDATLEKLADKGNGNYGYIDSRREAEKLLVEQVNSTLLTIAKDVKVQVDFNPAQVASYRLIGYENRMLQKEDFNNDKIDAGEIGAGHTVTALYEIVPVGAEKTEPALPAVDASKYQAAAAPAAVAKSASSASAELLTVKVRYKDPAGDVSRKLEFALADRGTEFGAATQDFKFAAAVAAFGMILRDSAHKGSATIGDVIAWSSAGLGEDQGGYRGDFVTLAIAARNLLR
jgi:Ca-activated chloride channel family protein